MVNQAKISASKRRVESRRYMQQAQIFLNRAARNPESIHMPNDWHNAISRAKTARHRAQEFELAVHAAYVEAMNNG